MSYFAPTLRLLLFLLLLVWGGCAESSADTTVWFENADGTKSPELQTEVVDNADSRARGLMYRRELAENQAMLFVFPDEEPRSFWMKNTYLELDMIFLDSQKKVVSIIERAVPLSEKPRLSEGPAKFVVEVRGGLTRKWGVAKGSTLRSHDS